MYHPIVHRITKPLRAGASVGIAGTDSSGVLRKGCTQGRSIIAALTTRACTLPCYPARVVVQTDGRRCQRGTIAGRYGWRSQTYLTVMLARMRCSWDIRVMFYLDTPLSAIS